MSDSGNGGSHEENAVDPGYTRLAVFHGRGHGLNSAHLAVLAVTGYRNARRAGKTLTETAGAIEAAVSSVFRGEAFTTGLLAELNTQTSTSSRTICGSSSRSARPSSRRYASASPAGRWSLATSSPWPRASP